MKKVITLCVVALALSLWAEKQPLSRYQTIIDRHPFGRPPVGFNPQKMASEVAKSATPEETAVAEQQAQLQKAVGFSVLNHEPNGEIMVGFVDRTDAKTPRHYYLAVGDEQDGWYVKDCDVKSETLTLVKDEIEVTLTLGSDSGSAAQANKANVKSDKMARPMLMSNSAAPAAPRSFSSRRARREAEEAKAKAEAEAKEREAKRLADEKAIREAQEREQRELERAEQRQQLLAIQEELRRAREEKARQEQEEAEAQTDENNNT